MKNPPMLLVDTNVWIDAYDGDREQHMRAHVLLDTAFERGISLAFAVSSLKDVYYALSSALKRQSRAVHGALSEVDARAAEAYAWACVQNMQEIATPVAVDASDVWLAGKFRAQLHDKKVSDKKVSDTFLSARPRSRLGSSLLGHACL